MEPIIEDDFFAALNRIRLPGDSPNRKKQRPSVGAADPKPAPSVTQAHRSQTKPSQSRPGPALRQRPKAAISAEVPAGLCLPEADIRKLHATPPAERQRVTGKSVNGQEIRILNQLCTCQRAGCPCRQFYDALDLEGRSRSADYIG